jgi:allophanate hydrolase subunit 2
MPRPLTCSEFEWEQNWRRHHQADRIRIRLTDPQSKNFVEGDYMTTASLHIGKLRKPTGAPVDINGKPAAAVLTGQVFTSSDPSIFTVTPDPADPTGFILTGVAEG